MDSTDFTATIGEYPFTPAAIYTHLELLEAIGNNQNP